MHVNADKLASETFCFTGQTVKEPLLCSSTAEVLF